MGQAREGQRLARSASAVIYLRVSTEDQTRGMSLESQEAICLDFCARNRISVDRVFVDRGLSAKTDEREAFQSMVAHCRACRGAITHVVVYKLDRLSRVAEHTLVYRAILSACGCRLSSATENLSDDPAGRLLGTILAGMNEYENDCKAQRVRDNMRHLQEAGYWTHQAPFGYAIARENDRPVLVPHGETGPILRVVFSRLASRVWSPAEARAHLLASGHRIGESRFYELIRSPIYAGLIATSLTRAPVRMRGEPLVDMDTYAAACSAIGGSMRRSTVDESAFPLRGVLRCPGCGERLTASYSRGRSGARYGYYHCRHGHVREREAVVGAGFAEALSGISSTYSAPIELVKSLALRLWEEDEQAAREASTVARARIAKIDEKRKRLLDALLGGAVDQATFTATDGELRAERDAADRQAVGEPLTRREMIETLDAASVLLHDLSAMWNRMIAAQRRAFANAMFPDGLVWSKQVRRTAASSSLFGVLHASGADGIRLASPTGFKSNRNLLAELVTALKPLLDAAA